MTLGFIMEIRTVHLNGYAMEHHECGLNLLLEECKEENNKNAVFLLIDELHCASSWQWCISWYSISILSDWHVGGGVVTIRSWWCPCIDQQPQNKNNSSSYEPWWKSGSDTDVWEWQGEHIDWYWHCFCENENVIENVKVSKLSRICKNEKRNCGILQSRVYFPSNCTWENDEE